jgi:hypothetical protein
MTTTEYKESAHLRFSTRISETLSGFDVSWTLTGWGSGGRFLAMFAQHDEWRSLENREGSSRGCSSVALGQASPVGVEATISWCLLLILFIEVMIRITWVSFNRLCGLVVKGSWLQIGDALRSLWGTNWIYICYIEESRPPLLSSDQSSWLQNGDVLCFLWSTNWIYICYVEESRPPLWSSGHGYRSRSPVSIPGTTRFSKK